MNRAKLPLTRTFLVIGTAALLLPESSSVKTAGDGRSP
jgi:hypothetical protein